MQVFWIAPDFVAKHKAIYLDGFERETNLVISLHCHGILVRHVRPTKDLNEIRGLLSVYLFRSRNIV
ncbi:uncharacterized protein PHALS_08921 [Plasmopara halstedii]|uniref:Uncharacterized protein n=1 Tax=Plasmopara halstedii TaxID=4781 RepID=A0A0P1AEQ8_PLAHL|nr:uncharacterized protein PHALS_08921 [Plasmopara halstedii]CEG38874.1 hypothetical protein PHALS_08921 [Plasmopara halstedii]|eukprot:XP_024575243.1 hypothetical protein PHALS_08921 [Plasmopara halstedii]